MSIADCKRGRRNFKHDSRYNRQMRKDPAKRAARLARAVEKEKLMRMRQKKKG